LTDVAEDLGDFDGSTGVAVYRSSIGEWFVFGLVPAHLGNAGDVPVPGNCDGDLTTDVAVYRTSTGEWLVRNQFTVQWGIAGNAPVPRDYNGAGAAPCWTLRCIARPPDSGSCESCSNVQWGAPGDIHASRAYVPRQKMRRLRPMRPPDS
jgi:hypothetical protein